MNMLNFWKSDEVKRVPEPVLKYMRRRFMLPTLYICSLRCFEGDGMHQGERVKKLRIFSPMLSSSFGITLKKSMDLDGHPELLLFEGYIDRSGHVYVADRRSPRKHKSGGSAGTGTDDGGNGQSNEGRIPRTRLGSYGPGAWCTAARIDEEDWS